MKDITVRNFVSKIHFIFYIVIIGNHTHREFVYF